MGVHFSTRKVGSSLLPKMQLLFTLVVFSLMCSSAKTAPSDEKEARTSYSSGPQCTDEKQRKCKKIPQSEEREECHEELEEVLDTQYVEECQDIATTHCEEFSQTVHGSYHLGYSGHGQVLLETEPGQIFSSAPKCEEKLQKQCTKVPKQEPHTAPRKVCNTVVYESILEECEDIIVTNCFEIHKQLFREVRIIGTDSYLLPPGQEFENNSGKDRV